MTYPIVGVGGKLGHGKDVFADHLVEQYGLIKQGMSDSLLRYALILNPWVHIDEAMGYFAERIDGMVIEGPVNAGYLVLAKDLVTSVGYTEAKRVSQEFREFLQKLGTEVGRDIDEDLWVNKARERALAAAESAPVIITGIRFPNEVKMIRGLPSGILVYIDRPDLQQTSGHASETSVSVADFDVVIENGSTLEQLYKKADLFYYMKLDNTRYDRLKAGARKYVDIHRRGV